MIKLLSINGSPVPESSTEHLLNVVADAVRKALPKEQVRLRSVCLNDLSFIPCQACGEDPTPRWCFFDDELTSVYRDLAEADGVLFGSPVYFDAVSAQAKAFIDRCNCMRPADFHHTQTGHDFIKRIGKKRPGVIVLVGGDNGWFEGARRCIAGFFKWVEVVNEGLITYKTADFNCTGEVVSSPETIAEAEMLGKHLARAIKESRRARGK